MGYDQFETCYEPELRLESKLKKQLIKNGWAVYVYRDGKAVGETYGATPAVIRKILGEDDIPEVGCEEYCYSTTVLPEYRGQGLGMELAQLSLIVTFPRSLCGHATSDSMRVLRSRLGAAFPDVPIISYAGTQRTACYYEHRRSRAASP